MQKQSNTQAHKNKQSSVRIKNFQAANTLLPQTEETTMTNSSPIARNNVGGDGLLVEPSTPQTNKKLTVSSSFPESSYMTPKKGSTSLLLARAKASRNRRGHPTGLPRVIGKSTSSPQNDEDGTILNILEECLATTSGGTPKTAKAKASSNKTTNADDDTVTTAATTTNGGGGSGFTRRISMGSFSSFLLSTFSVTEDDEEVEVDNDDASASASVLSDVLSTTTVEALLVRELGIRFIDARLLSTQVRLELGIKGYPSNDEKVTIVDKAMEKFDSLNEVTRNSMLQVNTGFLKAKEKVITEHIDEHASQTPNPTKMTLQDAGILLSPRMGAGGGLGGAAMSVDTGSKRRTISTSSLPPMVGSKKKGGEEQRSSS